MISSRIKELIDFTLLEPLAGEDIRHLADDCTNDELEQLKQFASALAEAVTITSGQRRSLRKILKKDTKIQ